ncbi:MAG: TIGR04295 family B12-binding domain-containing radical SAM protein [Acidobacteria bacterium]|nr:TIGR04295 family B12-binding domain-containing radical SAM protein [Acidobacteriota bacterium]
MKVALINPAWSFEGSIYFGCREPHLPLEYGYAKALLEADGHEALIVDGQLDGLSHEQIIAATRSFVPDLAVVTTAPSYLFWRCAPPELRLPQQIVADLRDTVPRIVIVGPHASTTPTATLRKIGADAAVMGECEDILPRLAASFDGWSEIDSLCTWDGDTPVPRGGTHVTSMAALPALRWPDASIRKHRHHHHRFDAPATGPGAEMETSRGCPYHCTFCAKDNFRNGYRKRPLPIILDELDALCRQGLEYVYFIDEIFLPNRELLQALAQRGIKIGVQTRIDLWNHELLDLLGAAGCVSIEAGVESISEHGRNLLDKNSRLSTEQITERLIYARERVPFVQANLIDASVDDPDAVERWREDLQRHGVWANKPVPLFPYPGSPDYAKRWGVPDEQAWERALTYYLDHHVEFSDIQDERPLPLEQLERPALARSASPHAH